MATTVLNSDRHLSPDQLRNCARALQKASCLLIDEAYNREGLDPEITSSRPIIQRLNQTLIDNDIFKKV